MYGSFYYANKYLERPPAAGVLTTLPMDTKFTLDIMNPYFTVVAYSLGGPTPYVIEYGRLDNREFAGGMETKVGIMCVIACIIMTLIAWLSKNIC